MTAHKRASCMPTPFDCRHLVHTKVLRQGGSVYVVRSGRCGSSSVNSRRAELAATLGSGPRLAFGALDRSPQLQPWRASQRRAPNQATQATQATQHATTFAAANSRTTDHDPLRPDLRPEPRCENRRNSIGWDHLTDEIVLHPLSELEDHATRVAEGVERAAQLRDQERMRLQERPLVRVESNKKAWLSFAASNSSRITASASSFRRTSS